MAGRQPCGEPYMYGEAEAGPLCERTAGHDDVCPHSWEEPSMWATRKLLPLLTDIAGSLRADVKAQGKAK